MPTYAYRCDSCGHEFEAVQRFADDPIRDCPVCGAAVRRVIQPVGVVFKGSGWYITDSRKAESDGSGPAKPAAADKPAGDDSAKTDAAKTDAATTSGKTDAVAKSDPVANKPAATKVAD